MQLSKIFLGVNIAATLSVALTGQAKAVDKSSTADFLKASLGSVSAKKPVAMKASAKSMKARPVNPASTSKFSSAKSVAVRQEMKSDKVKMMKFVPGRKLPTRQELALKAQKAQMAKVQAAQPLSASVSTYSPFYLSTEMQNSITSPKAKRASKRQARRAASKAVKKAVQVVRKVVASQAPRAVPGKNPVLPGQVGHPCSSIHSMDLTQHTMAKKHVSKPTHKLSAPDSHRVVAKELGKLEAPNLSTQERAQLDRLAKVLFLRDNLNKHPQGGFHSPLDSNMSARQRVDQAYSKHGPPPFPLNLIPEPAMKDFLSRARNRKSMIRNYPGAFASRPSNLQHSGFQSYAKTMKTGGFTSYSKAATNFSHHYASGHSASSFHSNITHGKPHHVAHSSHSSHKSHSHKVSHSVAHAPVIHKAHAKVATYGPYGSKTIRYKGL